MPKSKTMASHCRDSQSRAAYSIFSDRKDDERDTGCCWFDGKRNFNLLVDIKTLKIPPKLTKVVVQISKTQLHFFFIIFEYYVKSLRPVPLLDPILISTRRLSNAGLNHRRPWRDGHRKWPFLAVIILKCSCAMLV